MSAVAFDRRPVAQGPGVRAWPAVVVRLAAFAGLALFCALEWARLVAPARSGRMAVCVALALGVAAAWQRASALARPLRAAAALVSLLVAAVGVLAAAGVPGRLLAPAHLGDLASGLSQGIQSLPGIGVPYRGVDPWVYEVIAAAGGLLLVAAGLLAVRALGADRRPVAAAAVLATVYAVPVVERAPGHATLSGAAFTLLLGALLWGDRLERPHAAPAALFAGVALAAAMVLAPGLDTGRPWIDYQSIVDSLSTPPAIAYDWNHGYGPLDWPRDNREMLRVAAKTPVYFKAVELDGFDGVRWRVDRARARGIDTEIAPGHRSWHERLRVTVRDLRSSAYIGAGTALSVERSPRYAVPSAPGTFVTGRDPLRRGDSYFIDVYAPRPAELEMASASSDYPTFATTNYLSMDLPHSVGGPASQLAPGTPTTLGAVQVHFEQFGLFGAPAAFDPSTGRNVPDGEAVIDRSQYAPMYALARRLREEASTPYQFVRAVEAHLAAGFAYTETPPAPRPGRPPLVSFLFDSHEGYCQQFSGAMALLLRMGGVPARVASGFTPGVYDRPRGEWVVRDVDAHSWVEVYFPAIGWVAFDPTPGVAPPHDQLANGPAPPDVRAARLRNDPRRADVPKRHPAAGGGAPRGGGGFPVWLGLLGAAAAASAALAGAGALRARRRFAAVAPELAELHRALRRTGRPPAAGLTLQVLEHRYRHAPAAAGYVSAVRMARFGGGAARPTARQRAALRAELATGLGPGGRLRAWWALPPAWGRRRTP